MKLSKILPLFLCLIIISCDGVKSAMGIPGYANTGKSEKSSVIPKKEKKVNTKHKYDSSNFYELCAYGSKKQIAACIRDGVSVNALDSDGFSPLFYAVLGNPKQYADSVTKIQNALRADDDKALYEALGKSPCVKGNLAAVKELIAHGANIQLTDRKKNTAFLYACMFSSDVNILKELVKAGADISEKLSANLPQPIINFAAFTNTTPECVYYIADTGKNVNESNQFGTTPIMWAAMYNSNPEVIDALINAGADINDPKHKDGYTPLHWAIRCNHSVSVAEHIIKLGADVNKEDKYGSTPLLWSICNENPKDTIEKIENLMDNWNYWPYYNPKTLNSIQQEGKPELVPLLLKGNPSSENLLNAYLLAYCLSPAETANAILKKIEENSSVAFDETELLFMCFSEDDKKIDALKKVLLKPEVSNMLEIDSSSLIVALLLKNAKVLHTLIQDFKIKVDYSTAKTFIEETKEEKYLKPVLSACENINKQDYDGETLLYYAVDKGNVSAVSILLANGAKVDMRYGDNYFTELIAAVNRRYPNDEIVKLLLQYGADVNARDKNGANVLIYAVNKNYTTSTCQILINNGANKTAKYNGSYVYDYCNDYIEDTSIYTKLYNAVSYYDYWDY